MGLELIGKIVEIKPTVQVSEKFKKREFALDITEEVNGSAYPNYALMQCAQKQCEVLDNFRVGEVVKVQFNVRGNRSEKDGNVRYFTNLDVWRIERQNATQAAPQQQAQQYNSAPANNSDSLPF